MQKIISTRFHARKFLKLLEIYKTTNNFWLKIKTINYMTTYENNPLLLVYKLKESNVRKYTKRKRKETTKNK